MDQSNIYKKVEQYVTDMFGREQQPEFVYHNLEHTEHVVEHTKEIAGHYQVDEVEMMTLYIAAWFHDTGYLFAPAPEHEKKSVELMEHFMTEYEMPDNMTNAVRDCILATARQMEPSNILQEIICDADTYNLGTKEFKKTNKLMYKEWKNLRPSLTRAEFDDSTIKLLDHHRFYTSYCQGLLEKYKKKNMKKIKKGIKKRSGMADKPEDEEDNLTISEKAGTTKGMQTMLRLTSTNHIRLSEMADSKANILISVNAIIISVILGVLVRKLQTDPYLTIPAMIFLASTVTTIVIAILATRPKVNQGTFDEVDVINKKTNLLFFGNFHKMPQKDYENAMKIMMTDANYLYSSMVQDIYNLGVVLGRKYKLIRMAYTIFMVGIIVSVLAFALASVIYVSPPEAMPTNSTGSPF